MNALALRHRMLGVIEQQVGDYARVSDWNRPLTIEQIKAINDVWHALIYDAKGDVCDHPERDRYQGYCWKCGRNVELGVAQ